MIWTIVLSYVAIGVLLGGYVALTTKSNRKHRALVLGTMVVVWPAFIAVATYEVFKWKKQLQLWRRGSDK